MSETNRCKACGAVLHLSALGGRCARCMLKLGVETPLRDPKAFGALSTVSESPEYHKDLGAHVNNLSIGSHVGHYRIILRIAEGGMGVVYEAEQEHPRRIVALKVIKPGLATPGMLRRFELEGEALGRLQYPGIAQIYEAG